MQVRHALIAAILLAGASTAAVLTAAPASAATATGPRWIIEQRQLAALPDTTQSEITSGGAVVLADNPPFKTSGEHYTTTGTCAKRLTKLRTARCLSLADKPPKGSYALVDFENWDLSSYNDKHHFCKMIAEAADEIRAAGAIPVLSTGSTRDDVTCAAKAAGDGGYLHIQSQMDEANVTEFAASLTTVAETARAANPDISMSFGLSTRASYGASASVLCAAYQAGENVLPGAPVWINMMPWPHRGGVAAAITMISQFMSECGSQP
jgi:hypothetical protein